MSRPRDMPAKPKKTARELRAGSAQRAARMRKRLAEQGLVPLQVWVRPEHKDAVVRFALRLNEDRK